MTTHCPSPLTCTLHTLPPLRPHTFQTECTHHSLYEALSDTCPVPQTDLKPSSSVLPKHGYLLRARNSPKCAGHIQASAFAGPAVTFTWGLVTLCLSHGGPEGASPHVPDVGQEEEELGQAPVLLLQGQACFGHQMDQGVYDLVQDSVDMVLLFQRLQSAGQKCVNS